MTNNTPEINPNARKWVKELRGRHYRQGRARLCNNGAFSCLGIACDVSKLGHWSYGKYVIKQMHTGEEVVSEHFLPDAVVKWLGITDNKGTFNKPVYLNGHNVFSLVELNDKECFSLKAIGDFIDNNWSLLRSQND